MVACCFEAVEQRGAAFAQGVDHGIAGVPERQCNVFAFFSEGPRYALRNFIDFVGDQVADRGDVVGKIKVDAGDGVAHLLGLIDQGFALVAQFGEQVANADFIIVVGALQRGHFIVDQGFELGRAGERAFDAVAHGGNLAPDGLADRHDRLARDGLGLGKPHCHFGHGFGDHAHVLRAVEHMSEQEEEDDRHDNRGGDRDHGRKAGARAGGVNFAAVKRGDRKTAGGPDKSDNGGCDIRRARGAVAQRLENLSDAGAVVVGGTAWRRCISRRPTRRRCVLREKIGGRARRGRIGGIKLGGGAVRIARAWFGCANTERLLDGGERLFGCVFCFLWSIRHFGRRLVITPDCRRGPNRHDSGGKSCHERGAVAPTTPQTSPIYRPTVILSPWQCERNHRW